MNKYELRTGKTTGRSRTWHIFDTTQGYAPFNFESTRRQDDAAMKALAEAKLADLTKKRGRRA